MIRPLLHQVLNKFDVFSMSLDEHGERIKALGADPHKVKIQGNAKYDLLAKSTDPAMEREMREILTIDISDQVIVAGSTREGEEALVLEAYERIVKELPHTILIICPRHIQRTRKIASLLDSRGHRHQLRSELRNDTPRTERIVIMDTYGELFKLYSIADIVFCGASLVPLGGQNPMEAAVWGKAIFYGPYMDHFTDVKQLLETNHAAIVVADHEEFADQALQLLGDRHALQRYGNRAREVVLNNVSAADKHARAIVDLIE